MLNKAQYQFAFIDRTQAWVGVDLVAIIHSWIQLERWFNSRAAQHQVAIGYVSYEQRVYFGIFKRLERRPLDQVIDKTPFALPKLNGISIANYTKKLQRIQECLAVGDIYQANFCYRLTGRATATPQQLLYHFIQRQPTPYAALIDTPDVHVVSNSPELGIKLDGHLVEMRPMKGTRPSGIHYKQELQRSVKDQAELDMIIDVVRNDLSQFAKPGTVRVKRRRQIVRYNTVWQAQAVVQAMRPNTVSTLDVLRAVLPFASVTGAPKLRATALLAKLESRPRGVYCGAIGYMAGHDRAEFNVAIRTATLDRGKLTYSVGSGITVDSDPKAEYQETLDKAAILR